MDNLSKGYKKTEIGVIPEDWEVKTLGDIGDVKMCRRIFNNETTNIGEIPFFKIGTFGKEPDAYISNDLYRKYKKLFSFPKKGSILISAAGTIGRTIVYDGKPSYYQDSNIVWIDNNEKLISNEYLNYIFKIIKYNTEGGTIQRLYNSIINNAKFICPTKPEQTAIASTLSDIDSLITSLEKLRDKKILIKMGVVQKFFNRQEQTGKWKSVSFNSLCKTFTKQTGFDYSSTIKPQLISEYREGYIPFIQNKDFHGKYINYKTDYYIPENLAKNFPMILLDEECLLISISGSIGNIAIFTNRKKSFVGGAIAVAKFTNKKYLEWVLRYFQSEEGQKKLFSNVKSGAHHNLILEDIRQINIPIPDDLTQETIIKTLDQIEKDLFGISRKLDKYKLIKLGAMQQLLTGKIRLI